MDLFESFPDLDALDDRELKALVDELQREEREVSHERRIIHGRLDICRAELVNRLRKRHNPAA